MWKQLIAPTLVVAGFWFVVSPITTYFIYWLDQSYQHALTRNLASMHAAGEVRAYVWRILSCESTSIDHGGTDDPREMETRVDQAIRQIRGVSMSPEETVLINRLESQWHEFVTQARASYGGSATKPSIRRYRQVREKAKAISATVNDIRQANQRLWVAAERHREHWKGIVLTARFILILVGPAVGIALGWWISKRLHRSISQINIILKDATVVCEESLAKLRLSGREDLTDLRERVEMVVERLRQVSSELDAARRDTLRAERLAAVGELAAGVAHELRNPLTSVKLLLQNAAQQPGDTKLSDDETCIVIDEILRMENTIQGLLDFSRPPSPQRQRHDLRNTLQRALNLVQGRAKQHKVQIEPVIPDEPILVHGDPEQLHQVCVNVLINGIEADVGGVLEVDVEHDPQDRMVRVRFRDFGQGIPPDILVHLFEPFVSSKERGTGLGLAISRRIIIQHGGSLIAENHRSGGALFTIELPSANAGEVAWLRDTECASY